MTSQELIYQIEKKKQSIIKEKEELRELLKEVNNIGFTDIESSIESLIDGLDTIILLIQTSISPNHLQPPSRAQEPR